MPIDSVMYQATFGTSRHTAHSTTDNYEKVTTPLGPDGEVWYTYSHLANTNTTMHYIMGINLNSDYTLLLEEFHHIIARSGAKTHQSYWVVDNRDSSDIKKLSVNNPFTLTSCSLPDFHMFTVIGIDIDIGSGSSAGSRSDWSLQGEMFKWTSGASSRFSDIYVDTSTAAGIDTNTGLNATNTNTNTNTNTITNELVVDLLGNVGEEVTIGFISSIGYSILVPCVIDCNGRISVNSNGSCY